MRWLWGLNTLEALAVTHVVDSHLSSELLLGREQIASAQTVKCRYCVLVTLPIDLLAIARCRQ